MDVKKEFFDLIEGLYDACGIDNDYISLGNLACFVEKGTSTSNWDITKKKLLNLVIDGDRNLANNIVFRGVLDYIMDLKIEERYEFDIKRFEYAYKAKMLINFHLAREDIFPKWFKEFYNFNKKDTIGKFRYFYKRFNKEEKNPLLEKKNIINFWYLMDWAYYDYRGLRVISDVFNTKTVNEFCWVQSRSLYRLYFLELKRLKLEDKISLDRYNQLNHRAINLNTVMENLYHKNELFFLDVFPKDIFDYLVVKKDIKQYIEV